MSRIMNWFLVAIWLLSLFGDALPWTWRWAAVAVFVCVFLGMRLWRNTEKFFRPPGFAALAGWLALLLFQCLPLPPAVLGFLSPGSHSLYSETIWVLRPGTWMPLAVAAQPAFSGIMQFWVLASVFWLTAQAGADHIALGKLLKRFATGAGVVAVLVICALPFRVQGWNALLPPGIVVALAAVMPLVLTCHLYVKPQQNYGKWTTRVIQTLRHPGGHLPAYLLAFVILMGGVVLFCGAVQTRIALVGGLLIMTVMLLARRGSRSRSGAAVVITLVMLLVVGIGTWQIGRDRGVQEVAPVSAGLDQKVLARDFLLAGAGPGNLPSLVARYTRLREDPGAPLEGGKGLVLLSAGGLAGTVMSLWFWVMVLVTGIIGWAGRRNHMALFLLPGILAGLIVCFASGIDTSQPFASWPGMAAYFLAALLIGIGCFSSTGEPGSAIGNLHSVERRVMMAFCIMIGLAGSVYVLGKVVVSFGPPIADDGNAIEGAAPQYLAAGVDKYLLFDPLADAKWYAAGNYMASQRMDDQALRYYKKALRLNPLAGDSIYRLGVFLSGRGHGDEGAALMQAGLKNAPLTLSLRRDHLLYMLTRGERKAGLEALSELLLLAPDQTGFWLRYFESRKIAVHRWLDYLPPRAEAYRQYGDYLIEREEKRAAEAVYRRAIRHAVAEPWVSTDMYLHVAGYFIGQERFEPALEVLRAAMEAHPEDLTLLVSAAGLYERMGIVYRARELYRKALLLDPDNSEVRLRLDALF